MAVREPGSIWMGQVLQTYPQPFMEIKKIMFIWLESVFLKNWV